MSHASLQRRYLPTALIGVGGEVCSHTLFGRASASASRSYLNYSSLPALVAGASGPRPGTRTSRLLRPAKIQSP
jgi:hypothetical protein